jgi:hypothetical protein
VVGGGDVGEGGGDVGEGGGDGGETATNRNCAGGVEMSIDDNIAARKSADEIVDLIADEAAKFQGEVLRHS